MTKSISLGLVGWPLTYSLSPSLHNVALDACRMKGNYSLYPIAPFPHGEKPLLELLHRMRTGELDGLNITVPHKLDVMPFLDELTPTAMAVGAVNTILIQSGNLVGENTDVFGFLEDIRQYIQLDKGGHALVIGAGGAARAVVYTLLEHEWEVSIVSRRAEQVEQLIADFTQAKAKPIYLSYGFDDIGKGTMNLNFQLIVNATPLGMPPLEDASPWPEEISLPQECFVYDLIYSPAETILLRSAKKQGLRSANGLGMLIKQAARSFLQWADMPDEKLSFIQEAMWEAITTIEGVP